MQHTTIALTILTAFTLTACGGGGGGNNQTSTPSNPTNPTTPTVDPAIQSFNSDALAHGKKVAGSVKRDKTGVTNYQANPDNGLAALNSIKIDGKDYAVAAKGKNQAEYNYLGAADYNAVSSGSFLSYSRFAVLNIKDYVSDSFLAFGQYTLVKDMPATGKALYHGHGLHQHKDVAELIATDVNADVDFAAKTAVIDITGDNLDLSLSGNIKGNKVGGSNSLSAAFYGPDAAELAGSYAKDGNGVFGAVKK